MKCLFSSVLLSLLLLAAVDAITDTTVLSTSSLTTQTTTPHPAFDCQNNNPCGTVEGQFFFRHIISQLYIQCGVGTSCFERSCKTGFDWDQSTLSCKKSNYTETSTSKLTTEVTTAEDNLNSASSLHCAALLLAVSVLTFLHQLFHCYFTY